MGNMTNGDFVRDMTNEQLADFLARRDLEIDRNPHNVNIKVLYELHYEKNLMWLNNTYRGHTYG